MSRPNRTNPAADHLDNGVFYDFAVRDRTDFVNGLTITWDGRPGGTEDPANTKVPTRWCVTHQSKSSKFAVLTACRAQCGQYAIALKPASTWRISPVTFRPSSLQR